jgi:hypothetical protein
MRSGFINPISSRLLLQLLLLSNGYPKDQASPFNALIRI